MVLSLSALKELTKGELFDNMLSNINTELTSLRDRFTKMQSHFLVTRTVNDNLVKQNRILTRKCAANEQNYM